MHSFQVISQTKYACNHFCFLKNPSMTPVYANFWRLNSVIYTLFSKRCSVFLQRNSRKRKTCHHRGSNTIPPECFQAWVYALNLSAVVAYFVWFVKIFFKVLSIVLFLVSFFGETNHKFVVCWKPKSNMFCCVLLTRNEFWNLHSTINYIKRKLETTIRLSENVLQNDILKFSTSLVKKTKLCVYSGNAKKKVLNDA